MSEENATEILKRICGCSKREVEADVWEPVRKTGPGRETVGVVAGKRVMREEAASVFSAGEGGDFWGTHAHPPRARDGSTRALSPGTVRLRREHLRLAASALARRLGYTRRVINLAALVEPVNFKLVLAEYVEAAGGGGSGAFVQGLAVPPFGVGRQWGKAPASPLGLAPIHL